MTINHIDQLNEWWKTAEEGVIEKGDTVIHRSDGETTVYVAVERAPRQHPNSRILSRAPKPKPAWHDAVAVIARTHACSFPRVFAKDENGIWNDALAGRGHSPDALLDVTPLIEAKVTDEMVERLEKHFADHSNALLPFGLAPRMIAAALGLDPA